MEGSLSILWGGILEKVVIRILGFPERGWGGDFNTSARPATRRRRSTYSRNGSRKGKVPRTSTERLPKPRPKHPRKGKVPEKLIDGTMGYLIAFSVHY